MKNGWIIGEMDKSYDKFKQKWHNNLPLDCWYPGVLGRYTRFKVLHPNTSNQSRVIPVPQGAVKLQAEVWKNSVFV